MQTLPLTVEESRPQRSGQPLRTLGVGMLRVVTAVLATLMTGAGIETQQRKLIFQLGARPDRAAPADNQDMSDRWIEFESKITHQPVRLHALWLEHSNPTAPVLLYLHGARWDVTGSLQRMRQLHALGFSVLGVDYRGFGRSTAALPSEASACEDAHAAWCWIAKHHPEAPRYIYGHSLGGAIAVHLASEIDDASGVMVEGTFTSIPEVFGTLRWGWLPLRALITQRFDSFQRVAQITAPLLVVHGSRDELINPAMGHALYERATAPKRFVLVEGGSHHDTHNVGHFQYREAVRELFGLVA